jgi:hypothetical protein
MLKIFEGDEHKVEAILHVNEAIPKHGGKYQCNRLHPNFHTLRVHSHNTDEYFELFPFTPVKETNSLTTIDESLEIINPTTTKHHHIHQNKKYLEPLENISTMEFANPISFTTMSIDNIETEDYDNDSDNSNEDILFKKMELPEIEKNTNIERENIVIDETNDVLNESETTVITEMDFSENGINPLSAIYSTMTFTVTTELTVPDLVVITEPELKGTTLAKDSKKSSFASTSTVETTHIEPSLVKGER